MTLTKRGRAIVGLTIAAGSALFAWLLLANPLVLVVACGVLALAWVGLWFVSLLLPDLPTAEDAAAEYSPLGEEIFHANPKRRQ